MGLVCFHFTSQLKSLLQCSVTYQVCADLTGASTQSIHSRSGSEPKLSQLNFREVTSYITIHGGNNSSQDFLKDSKRQPRGAQRNVICFLLSPSFQDPHLLRTHPPRLHYSMKSKQRLHHCLVTFRPLFKQITLPGKSSTHTHYFSSRPKKFFLVDFHPHSSRCSSGIPLAL